MLIKQTLYQVRQITHIVETFRRNVFTTLLPHCTIHNASVSFLVSTQQIRQRLLVLVKFVSFDLTNPSCFEIF